MLVELEESIVRRAIQAVAELAEVVGTIHATSKEDEQELTGELNDLNDLITTLEGSLPNGFELQRK